MTKQTIESLQAQLNSIQQQIEALAKEKEATKGETPWELAETYEVGYSFPAQLNGDIESTARESFDELNSFKSRSVAEGFDNAFHVMIALRQCEGAGKLDEACCGHWMDENEEFFATTSRYFYCFGIFPPFPSEELAHAAANKVGKDKIIAAYKFLSNVE